MTQPRQPTVSPRHGLVAIAVIALSVCFAIAPSIASANVAQTRGASLTPTLDEPRAEEEIWEEEGWDERNSEEDEGEEAEEEPEGSNPPTAECNLYATAARLVVSDRHDSVRLTVRYETEAATSVKVEYWLKGARGSVQLEPLKRHMSRQGTIQGSERLDASQMEKAQAARVFVVHLELPGLPPSCERYCTRRLTARHQSGSRVTWSEPALYKRPVR